MPAQQEPLLEPASPSDSNGLEANLLKQQETIKSINLPQTTHDSEHDLSKSNDAETPSPWTRDPLMEMFLGASSSSEGEDHEGDVGNEDNEDKPQVDKALRYPIPESEDERNEKKREKKKEKEEKERRRERREKKSRKKTRTGVGGDGELEDDVSNEDEDEEEEAGTERRSTA